MIYTPLTKKALAISFNAHKNQTDKSGAPYVYHPFHVAEQMDDEYSTCVALLHDTVEDTDITLDYLKSEGFPDEVIDALALMTHDDDVPYMDYIEQLRGNPLACKVKIADLTHNSDLSRLDVVTEADIARVEKYQKAMGLLSVNRFNNNYKTVKAWKTPCCNAYVPEECSFCILCGKEFSDAEPAEMQIDLEQTITFCSKCGRVIPLEYRYCGYCGTKSRYWSEFEDK